MTITQTVVDIEKFQGIRRAHRLATVLAIGTATPSNIFYQADYPDYYFRATNSEHMVDLKDKFKRICEKTMIKKRHFFLTDKFLKENPNMCEFNVPSFNTRQDLLVTEIPKLGKEAATKAIKEWGLPKSKITHLIFCTSAGIDMPGADAELTALLGLSPSVQRLMMYQQGCSAGGMVLRVAKDICENNNGSRVLVVCSESIAVGFRGPDENHIDSLVYQALFGDGAAAIIVGSDPDLPIEHPLFEIVITTQTLLPNTGNLMHFPMREEGMTCHMHRDIPKVISENIEEALVHAISPLGITDWNSLFWIVHPGGRAILDQVELKLKLGKEKLRASRHVLSEYGNLTSACVLFIMDEMRRESVMEGKSTNGEGLDWGVLFGFGPGLTVETMVLRSHPARTTSMLET